MGRRALFVVVVSLIIIGGRGLSATTGPVALVHLTEGWATFGQAVPQGMAPAGSGLQIGGLPTQTDVKNRWPDLSIRFAIVTAKVPVGGGTYQINAGTLNTGTFAPVPQTAVVSLNISGCLPSAGPACPAGLHTAALPAPESATWLDGPLVHEARSVVRPVGPGAVMHPFLRVNFDTRVYNDGASRVDVSVENMLNSTAARTVTYDVAVTVPGAASFSKNNVEHAYLTRWRKLFSSSAFATIAPDLTPFNLARALPPYLSIVADQVDSYTGPDYEILREGALDRNMPAHSGRQELAPYPDWTARYLVHKNPLQRQFVLVNGDLSGGWPVHVRERENAPASVSGVGPERLVSLAQRPTVWLDNRAEDEALYAIEQKFDYVLDYLRGLPLPIREYGDIVPVPGSGETSLIPDNAHQPSIAYVPYLLTGDFYYAEEMAFWANYSMMRLNPVNPADGGTRGSLGILENQETRGYAWALRNLVDAAAYYPDSSPVKPYLAERVTANLQWLDGYVNGLDPSTNPFKILWLGYRGSQDAGHIALWEQNYLAYAIDRANQQGFIGGRDHRDAIAKLQLSLFTSEPDYPRFTILEGDVTFSDGTHVAAGTQMDWSAPYLLNVATVPDASRSWENPTYFQSMSQIAVGTTQGPSRFDRWRPYNGYYGPEARLNLMIGVNAGWDRAQEAYDYLFPFIGVNGSACGNISDGSNRPDLACRAGWALGFYPPYTPPSPTADEDADDDGINDNVDNCSAVSNADQLNTDGDAFGNACDTDDDNDLVLDAADAFPLNPAESVDTDNDGIGNNADPDDDNDSFTDVAEIAGGSNPLNAASTPETCDGIDNDLDGSVDEGFLDTDGDGRANCVDPDDDNDTRLDGVDPRPLIANVAPVATMPAPPPATVGVAVTLTLNATDADGDLLTYTATGLPGGLSLPPGSKVISGTPNTPGTFTVVVTVSDGLLTGTRTFTWVVNDTPDDPLVLDKPKPQTSTEGEWVSLQLKWDSNVMKRRRLDLRPVHFEAKGLPRALHIDKDGTISGNVGKKAAGVYHVTVTLRAGKQEVSQQFTWTILDANRAPRLRNIGTQSSKVGASARLVMDASDPDGDSLTFTVSGLPPGLSMSGGVITGTVGGPTKEYRVTATVSDGKLSESETFDWKVTAVKKDEPKKDDKGKK